jgi:hypothetical protein
MAMVTSDVSANFLDNHHLKALWKQFFGFHLPNRRSFNQLITTNETQINSLLMPHLLRAKFFCLETDGWTNVNNLAFNALLAHFISNKFQKITVCVGLSQFDKKNGRKQTAINLAADLTSVASKFLPNLLSKAGALVADGTNLMPATARALQKQSLTCLAHKANLILKELVMGTSTLCSLCGISSLIVSTVRRSTFVKQNVGKTLQPYVATRFYSFLEMIASVHNALPELTNFCAQYPNDTLNTAVSDFKSKSNDVSAVLSIFQPFQQAFTVLGATQKSTSDLAILFILTLERSVSV